MRRPIDTMSRFGLADGMTAYSVAFGVFAPMQFIFSARVRNTYDPLDLSPTLRIPIAVTLAVAVLNVVPAAIGGLRLG